MRKLAVLVSDMHSGHKLGLCNPDAKILNTAENPPKEQGVCLVEWQEYLWDVVYSPAIEKVVKLAGKDEIIVNILGDIVQGSKFPNHLVAFEESNHCKIAYYNLLPWLSIPNVHTMRLTTGTPTHEGENLSAAVTVADVIRNEREIDIKVAHHFELNIDNFLLDIAHHGAHPGIRLHTRGNMLRYEMGSAISEYIENGEVPPDCVARGHFHMPVEETITRFRNDEMKKFTYLLVPSLTGMVPHARKVTKSISKVTNGICALEIIDGKLVNVHWFTKTIDTRYKEKV